MGEVWKARDTRLDREVAVKVSAEQFSDRFEREARAIAALNHPNICTLFDVGPNYLVMELIDGPTLADRIAEGPIPLEEALVIARQIADALEAAHEKNIVHRDLKPGNIKVRSDGSVKVLDFGLAKAGLPGAEVSHDSPTLVHSPTMVGVILGTAAYMAPEQARGKVVDKRADIWSFGVVLHEMLTGKRTFEGEDLTETLASVVKSDPDLTVIPHKVRRLLAKCLQKDPKKRLRDIGDAWDYLDAPAAPVTAPSQSRLGMVMSIVAGVLALALAGLAFLHFREPSAPLVALQLEANTGYLELSPDSRMLAWVAPDGDTPRIWVRSFGATEAHPLAGTDGATYPFWSPDSAWIGFFSQGKLRKVPVGGGPIQNLCDAADGRGGAWNKDGVILFSPSPIGGLLRVPEQGGTPVAVLSPIERMSAGLRFPHFLPDQRHFLFDRTDGLFVASLDGGTPVRLAPDPVKAVFVPSAPGSSGGHLLFTRQRTLVALGFDSRTLSVSGNPVSVAPEVQNGGNTGYGLFTATESSLVYMSSVAGQGAMRELAWFDRSGQRLSVAAKANRYLSLNLSPDEQRVAAAVGDATTTGDIWILDLTRGTQERFAFGSNIMSAPLWSPDGGSLLWTERKVGAPWEIHRRPLSGGVEGVLATGTNVAADSFTPDGKQFIFQREEAATAIDIWVMPMEGDRTPRPLIQSPNTDSLAQVSPDGKWIAWQSNESGRVEVYVQPFPGPGPRVQISTNGGVRPMWRRDGRELYFTNAQRLMAVPFDLKTAVRVETPKTLFRTRVANPVFAPSHDGQRFLMPDTVGGEETPPVSLTVVLNWQTNLKK